MNGTPIIVGGEHVLYRQLIRMISMLHTEGLFARLIWNNVGVEMIPMREWVLCSIAAGVACSTTGHSEGPAQFKM